MRWAKVHQDASPPPFDLASSSLEAAKPADLGIGPEERLADLPLSGNNAYGQPRLIERIASIYGAAPEQAISTPGSSAANFLLAATLLDPGDRAVCEWPCYEPLWRVVEAAGAEPRFVERRPRAERYALDLDGIGRELARGARLVILTNLYNPAGTLIPADALAEVGRLCERHDAHALVDEVYIDGIFDPARRERTRTAFGLSERFIVTSSLTKVYGLGGLRAGWAVGPAPAIRRAWEAFDHVFVENVYPGDMLALRAFDAIERLRERARARHAENLPVLRAFVEGRRDLEWLEPDGGFVAFVKMANGLSSAALEPVLRERHGAQVAPGSYFGDDSCIRIGFGCPQSRLREGLARVGAALSELR